MLSALTPVTAVHAGNAPSELLACRIIEEPDARLACYDLALDHIVSGSPQDTPQATASQGPANTPGTPCSVTPTTAVHSGDELFGKSATAIAEALSGTASSKIPESLSAAVTSVVRAGDQRLMLTLDNGQIWRRVDTAYLDMHVGDRVTIRAAALGSFLLSGERSHRTIRVSRLR